VSDSYYGRPVLKEPVWTWEIPAYFFVGGLAGASSALALGARLSGRARLARRLHAVALAGLAASPALLVSDLGRPERFLNMLRVFKVTSPMSVGSWLLAANGGAATLAALGSRTGAWASALLGLPLSSYTGALVADTAIPVWHEARRELPLVFASGAAASAGAAGMLVGPTEETGPARRLAVLGAVAELGLTAAMERRLGFLGEVYREGAAGRLGTLAKACFAAGAIAATARRRRLGGSLLLAASALARWSVYKAGFQSARDPRYVVEPQRDRSSELRADDLLGQLLRG
jgi:formate-dependent nitrite reductase membrane component NrfD